jgi:hypothetical protein
MKCGFRAQLLHVSHSSRQAQKRHSHHAPRQTLFPPHSRIATRTRTRSSARRRSRAPTRAQRSRPTRRLRHSARGALRRAHHHRPVPGGERPRRRAAHRRRRRLRMEQARLGRAAHIAAAAAVVQRRAAQRVEDGAVEGDDGDAVEGALCVAGGVAGRVCVLVAESVGAVLGVGVQEVVAVCFGGAAGGATQERRAFEGGFVAVGWGAGVVCRAGDVEGVAGDCRAVFC